MLTTTTQGVSWCCAIMHKRKTETMMTPERVHDALKQIPTQSPFTNTLSFALALMTKGEKLQSWLENAVNISVSAIEAQKKGAEDVTKTR